MDDSLKIYWKVFAEKVPTERIIKQAPNPLRGYEDEFIDGAIIDIGCGQSNFLLEYASLDRPIYAVDNDQSQLDYLKHRASEISKNALANWKFMNLNFPTDKLPADAYSVIILSNLLHFFTVEECKKIEKALFGVSQKGTLIYISVHSYKHYMNDPDNPDNHEYFRHYFKMDDLVNIFPVGKYEFVYQAEIDKNDSKNERNIINEWFEKMLEDSGLTDLEKETEKREYLRNMRQSDIQIILRKK